MNVIFFGTPPFAVPALRAVSARYSVHAVVTAPDKPVGRKAVITASAVGAAAKELKIPIHMPVTLKDDMFFAKFSDLKPDLCIVVAYGKIIPPRYLAVPCLGFVNVHPSLLPAYRGPSPIQTAILDGCVSTGVSLILLDDQVDHGPVVATVAYEILSTKYYPEIEKELAELGAELLVHALPGYINGLIVPVPQDHALATFTKKIERANGEIDWTQSAVSVRNRIRALTGNQGAWMPWKGEQLNVIGASDLGMLTNGVKPGTISRIRGHIAVATGTTWLALERLQRAGGKQMSALAFANGHPQFISSPCQSESTI